MSQVARPFGMSLTGMKKHIRLLEEAELVTRRRSGVSAGACLPRTPSRVSAHGCNGSTASRRSSNARKETNEHHHRHHAERARDRVERVFDAPRPHVFSVWTDPALIPEWWGDGTVVEEMDVRPGGTYRFRTAFGVVEGEFREVDAPERLVQTFQNHLQTLEFEDLGEQTKVTQTMRFATTEERDATMQYGVEEGAKGGFERIDALLQRLPLDA